MSAKWRQVVGTFVARVLIVTKLSLELVILKQTVQTDEQSPCCSPADDRGCQLNLRINGDGCWHEFEKAESCHRWQSDDEITMCTELHHDVVNAADQQHHVRNVRTVVCLFCCIFFSIWQECNVSKDHLKNCAMSAASPFLWNINNCVVCFEQTMRIDGVDWVQFCNHRCPVATLCWCMTFFPMKMLMRRDHWVCKCCHFQSFQHCTSIFLCDWIGQHLDFSLWLSRATSHSLWWHWPSDWPNRGECNDVSDVSECPAWITKVLVLLLLVAS